MDPVGVVERRRRKQLRAAAATLRERRPTPYSRDGDPELMALVEEPYTAVEEVPGRLRELLAAFEARDDRRAIFLSIYARMTEAVADRIKRGEFANPEWVGAYLVAFANLYREAVYDYERGALHALSDPWQLAFETAADEDALVLQDALLGVNAHINYDLAFAVDRAGVRPAPATKYQDHNEVTDVIAAIIDDAQDLLINQGADGLDPVDDLLGELDERLMVLTIDECRDSAWRTAVALNSRFDVRHRWAAWVNDITATGAAYLILGSQASDLVHETLVELEGSAGDVE